MRHAIGSLLLATLLASCGSPAPQRPVTLSFEGLVGGAAFTCGGTYPDVGTSSTTLTALDLRLYVHEVALLTSDGRTVPLVLDQDGIWQDGDLALLDFEDGDGCEGGNAPMNATVRGTVPDDGATYTGVSFRIGVPAERNHLDADTQPSPLNLSSLFWGWNDGYKFLRIEGRSTGQPGGFRLHVGATACTGDATSGTRVCANGNRPEIVLTGFDPDADSVVLDVADLFSTSDLDVDGGGAPGCMATADDPECPIMLSAIGIGGTQLAFHVRQGGSL